MIFCISGKTPTIEELDPSRVPDCFDEIGSASCNYFLNKNTGSYTCKENVYESYFKKNCYKTCKYC